MAAAPTSGRSGWPTALLCGVPLALPLVGALRLLQQGMPWALLAYAAASLLAIALYWHDKRSARKGRWRVPERILHGAELFGGWPGALLAQQVFRHKTRKVSYQAVFWGIVGLHQAFWGDWLLLGGFVIRRLLPEALATF
ncbi:DUF1294 domain-containing protein [Pseudomonas oryzae]|uniref:Uncharacterized membrane protein YsdA, DUF1294 family n=1 Tax=Pseudomonas oryzae TaxID=1392877 RepID=A0A1H1R1W3_9PSED|nr:DUF1294 domain-containing protein [Pseudomonas oryzae]SDS29672.1 Uncharacterized membrane protein YsdA, DUF1294 family [Pseudomonas oryzae]